MSSELAKPCLNGHPECLLPRCRLASRKHKYKKGQMFNNIEHLYVWLKQGNWIYLHDKVMHPGWILSMTFQVVGGFMYKGFICRAERNP